MLAKFAVKNFRGFKERIEIDLTRHSNYTFNSLSIICPRSGRSLTTILISHTLEAVN